MKTFMSPWNHVRSDMPKGQLILARTGSNQRREVVIFMLVNKPEHSIQNKESSLNEEDDFLPFRCHYIQIDGWMTVRVLEHISNQIHLIIKNTNCE